MRITPLFVFLAASLASAQFSTVTCTHGETGTCRQANTCNQSDIQAAVTASSAGTTGYASPTSFGGDGVYVPAGSCSWSSAVSWSGKNINVIGANPTITHSSSDAFDVTMTTAGATGASFRISGFTFSGTAGGHMLLLSSTGLGGGTTPTASTAWAGFFRVDNITYNYTSSANVVQFNGSTFGLFDHLNGTNNGNHFEQSNYLDAEYNATHGGSPSNNQLMGEYAGRLLSAGVGSSAPGGLGSKYMDFIEDSTFSCPNNYGGAISDSESGGQRMVFRHNTLSGTCFWYAHWTRGTEWDGDLYEIYNNVNTGDSHGQNPSRFGSGTGVIFNNSFPGTWTDPTFHVDETRGCGGETTNGPAYSCDGNTSSPAGRPIIDGNAGDVNAPGWPCAGQIGTAFIAGNGTRGGQGNLPLLAWNNGTQTGCSTGGSCTNSFTILVDGPQGTGNTCTRTMTNYISSTPHVVSGALNGAVDYCQGGTTMPATCGTYTNTYAPYTYPNPLQGGVTSYNFTVATAGTGSGTLAGTLCTVGTTSQSSGTAYNCTATATSGTFTSWADTCGGTVAGNNDSGTITSNCGITATFTLSSSYNSVTSGNTVVTGTVN